MGNASPFISTPTHGNTGFTNSDVQRSFILSKTIKEGAHELETSSKLRTQFVSYIFNSKRWLPDVIQHPTMCFFPHLTENGTSSRIFYHLPNGGYFYIPKDFEKSQNNSSESSSDKLLSTSDKELSTSIATNATVAMSVEEIDNKLFVPETAGYFLVAILLPFFMKTADYRHHISQKLTCGNENSINNCEPPTSSPTNSLRRMRAMVTNTAQVLFSEIPIIKLKKPHFSPALAGENGTLFEEEYEEVLSLESDGVSLKQKRKQRIVATKSRLQEENALFLAEENQRLLEEANVKENISLLEHFLTQTLSHMNHEEVTEALVQADVWLSNVLRYIENLKYSIAFSVSAQDFLNPSRQNHSFFPWRPQTQASFLPSLHKSPRRVTAVSSPKRTVTSLSEDGSQTSSSSPRSVGFPLVYVNQAFENTTQYSKEEVLGHSCAFLQDESCTEMQQIELMKQQVFRERLPVKLAVTNVKKDESPFWNLLSMKPFQVSIPGKSIECGSNSHGNDAMATSGDNKLVPDLKVSIPAGNYLPDTAVSGMAIVAILYDYHAHCNAFHHAVAHEPSSSPPSSCKQRVTVAEDLVAIDLLSLLFPLLLT